MVTVTRLIGTSALLAVAATAALGCGSSTRPAAEAVGRVTLTVTGGFTGWYRVLTVESDGTATAEVVRGPTPAAAGIHVDPAVLARLHALVSDVAFARLKPAYLPPPGGADQQDYTVTAEVGRHTIRTMSRDGAVLPPILSEVLAILNGILSAAASP
jgi:hypothetical protein